ncbi:putative hydroxymethylpyrimidine transport system ATP-binding protein [Volucribacter psittacicida]|uniref:Putative hydroxymethylpyrimidine transport system ATP-binding protein n=1 Tax=Volucribacter psittacicida TaxID=203482 RepID=A0A4R1FSP4_9PAST|nr:ABC transporter ATP-binding protein [Volucribacter psittacicida]TCJ97853.1 putative hydroxymethylpyrimidine transport system ATP-binding protein [Volucribacter psittacicida]
MKAIDIHQLTLSFGQQRLFHQFDFSLEQGEWVALLGTSGIGKSTLLRAIAGLEQAAISQGRICCTGKIAWLAQQDSLYPWLSLEDNVQLAQYLNGNKTAQTRQRAYQLLEAVNMAEHRHKPCYQLSGGQRQRVALARTLMQEAEIILMDEPFSALDAVTRLQLQDLTYQLFRDKTLLLITHDPQEALRLADKIYVLNGEPVQLSYAIEPQGQKPRQLNQQTLWQLQQQLLQQLMETS